MLLMAASLALPWFEVPLASGNFAAVLCFKGLSLGALAALLLGARMRGDRRARGARLMTGFLIGLLYFPYAVTIWSPEVAGRARWLQVQHDSLTSPSGDLYLAQEDKDTFWRQRIGAVNRPLDTAIVRFPDWGAQAFRWGRLGEVTQWFGMTGWFAGFVCKGWVCALAGGALVLLACLRESREGPLRAGLRTLREGGALLAAASVLALLPPLAAIAALAQAERAVHHARPVEGLAALVRAQRWMPALREDPRLLAQIGSLETQLGVDSASARFWQATQLENRGFDLQARATWLDGLADPRSSTVLARECGRALLRQGINALNNGELSLATGLLEAVLAADQCNLKE
jgi:hypothetical protein